MAEAAVDDDQGEKRERERDQVRQLVHREAVEHAQRLAAEEGRQRELELEKRHGRRGLGETLALDRLVDDRLGQVEHRKVDQHRRQDQRHDHHLFALAVSENEPEQGPFHGSDHSASRTGSCQSNGRDEGG